MAQDLIFTKPVFHNKIWGGRRLETVYGYDIPAGSVGECWAISAHPHGDCHVEEGPYTGLTLSQLWKDHHELFGDAAGDRFPLLIKILDAEGDLSVQVHPDDEYAREHEHGSLGKKECWYILDCRPGATIVIGQRSRNRAEFARLAGEGRWDELLNEVPVHRGDFFQIDPGTLHAIKAGTLVLETQQSSDVTYRVYDYGRLGSDGKPRDLQLKQAMDVIDFEASSSASAVPLAPEVDGAVLLGSNDRYSVERIRVAGAMTLPQKHDFLCVSVIDGSGSVNGHVLRLGRHFVAPAESGPLAFKGAMTLICSWV